MCEHQYPKIDKFDSISLVTISKKYCFEHRNIQKLKKFDSINLIKIKQQQYFYFQSSIF